MFEIWVLQQILISIFIAVVLGGFLSLILGYRIGKKFPSRVNEPSIKDESIVKQKQYTA